MYYGSVANWMAANQPCSVHLTKWAHVDYHISVPGTAQLLLPADVMLPSVFACFVC